VHKSNEVLNRLMEDAGRLINIAPHRVGPSETLLHSVADIEGHVGTDRRFYVLDFARTAPPQVCCFCCCLCLFWFG
jgi:hypothetical protein